MVGRGIRLVAVRVGWHRVSDTILTRSEARWKTGHEGDTQLRVFIDHQGNAGCSRTQQSGYSDLIGLQ